jgi:hypothetical protein
VHLEEMYCEEESYLEEVGAGDRHEEEAEALCLEKVLAHAQDAEEVEVEVEAFEEGSA